MCVEGGGGVVLLWFYFLFKMERDCFPELISSQKSENNVVTKNYQGENDFIE